MAKKQDNIFGSFGADVTEREEEQRQIENAVMGKPAHPAVSGRPRKRVDATTMSISISKADKLKVKKYAFEHTVTVSDLIHIWINQHCVEDA